MFVRTTLECFAATKNATTAVQYAVNSRNAPLVWICWQRETFINYNIFVCQCVKHICVTIAAIVTSGQRTTALLQQTPEDIILRHCIATVANNILKEKKHIFVTVEANEIKNKKQYKKQ